MGWFILRDRKNLTMFTLWNPITRNSILLPELLGLPEETEPDTYIFNSPPYYEDGFDTATEECVLLLFCKGLVFMCRPTSDGCKWVKQRLEHDGESVRIVKAAILNGDIYAYADLFNDNEDDDHGSFHTVFARLTVGLNSVVLEALTVECPSSKIVYKMFHRRPHYLVEVCGVLYGVTIIPRQLLNIDGYDILRLCVWKLDFSKMEWIQVDTLGDCSLLLGDNCCSWCYADASGGRIEGNCVYMVNRTSDTIHQYRLQDSSYMFLSSHTNFQNVSDGPIWFMPYNPARLPSSKKAIVEKIEDTGVENSEQVKELKVMTTEISKSFLLQLPSEVMISISNSLHWFDCLSLRATCKKLRSVIPKPAWKSNSPLPLFMFLKNNEGICELWDPSYLNDGSITKKLPYSISIVSTIEFSKDGWLIMHSHEGCYLQFINLFTGESGEYPTESLAPGHSSFLFSTCPTSPDCLTVGISGMTYATISILQARDVKWFTVVFEIEESLEFQSNYNSSPKYHDGSFYFLDENGNLGILKMEDGGCSWNVYKSPLLEDDDAELNECYVAELNGQLIYVFIQDVGSQLEMYTFDVNEELWAELKSLGDFSLFVSSASSVSVAMKDSSMRNRIYLPKRVGNEMVFYSLDTGKYHTSRSKESYENFHGMISQSFSCWV
ncbi:uncharacterized protein LOC141642962 [Silene latifolia]|uniref:uncharacterized protein LOC141642962 n=1 Tax=Silene latifolia TaxID=37657 RepID=UPI003D76AE96